MAKILDKTFVLFFLCVSITGSVNSQESEVTEYALASHIQFEFNKVKIIEYQSSCALLKNQALTHREGKHQYLFKGSLGLAPDWAHRPFTKKEQEWISACLLARTNFYGVPVKVFFTGEHPRLKNNISYQKNEIEGLLQEGAFYGNLYRQDDQENRFVCSGNDIEINNEIFEKRICALTTSIHKKNKCGFIFMGPCEKVCRKQNQINGAYSTCKDLHGNYHDAVITTYLNPGSPQ